MNSSSKKIDILRIMAITIIAISISVFDFDNLSWDNNSKSYTGLLLSLVLIVLKYRINKIKK